MTAALRVAFPGSFDPPTIAHLAVARAAHERLDGARVHWIVSRIALGKELRLRPTFDERVAVLRVATAPHPWLSVAVTESRFIADIAHGYDAVVVGADKWRQVIDPKWYADAGECARMRALLPRVLVVPRADDDLDEAREGIELLVVAAELRDVSSTTARSGDHALMLPAARAHAARTGHWASRGAD